MAVLIEDPEADRLIRLLAARTGETVTQSVRMAVEERLQRVQPTKGRVNRDVLRDAQEYFASLPTRDRHRTDEQILGYNDEGHFD